jgi:hypothetical protein
MIPRSIEDLPKYHAWLAEQRHKVDSELAARGPVAFSSVELPDELQDLPAADALRKLVATLQSLLGGLSSYDLATEAGKAIVYACRFGVFCGAESLATRVKLEAALRHGRNGPTFAEVFMLFGSITFPARSLPPEDFHAKVKKFLPALIERLKTEEKSQQVSIPSPEVSERWVSVKDAIARLSDLFPQLPEEEPKQWARRRRERVEAVRQNSSSPVRRGQVREDELAEYIRQVTSALRSLDRGATPEFNPSEEWIRAEALRIRMEKDAKKRP